MPWRTADRRAALCAGPARCVAGLPQRATRRVARRPAARACAGLHGRHLEAAVARRPHRRRRVASLATAAGGPASRRIAAARDADAMRQCAAAEGSVMARRIVIGIVAVVAVVAVLAAAIVWLNIRGEDATPPVAQAAGAVARGAYLARVGNCIACHTERGGTPFAGGRAVETPCGTVHSSNLTPDAATGIGAWSSSDFWRALHNGRSRDGRLLAPAFPYPNYTRVTREDSDAIFAYLRSLPAVQRANTPHNLRWPYSTQAALAVWRALYFTPGSYQADKSHPPEWNRGAYLVMGLGHCSACHTARNALG